MKKYIIAYMLTALVVFGCSDEFLDSTNKGTLSDESLANVTGLNLLLTAAYSALDGQVGVAGGWQASGDNWWTDAATDDSHKGSTNGDQATLHQIQTYDWIATNDYFQGKWVALYAGANRCNSVIQLANTIEDVDVTAQIAEARFLRGHYYFELSRIFGYVAYVDEEIAFTDPDVANPGPVWDEVEADFQYAIENLGDKSAGRPGAMAARAYKGKAHLYQGEWASAETEFDAVIASGEYSLNAEFNDNFNAAGKNSDEVVFSIQFEANDGAPNDANANVGGTLNFPGGGPFASCCGFYQPTQDLANAFKTDGGVPLLDTYSDSDIANDQDLPSAVFFLPETGTLDPRIDYTVGRRGIDYNGYGVHAGFDWVRAQGDAGPYLPKKNVYKSGETNTVGGGGWGQQHAGLHYNVIRYADVLLMAAEAKAEQGENADAIALVNQVRARAASSTTVKDADGADAANYDIAEYGDNSDALAKVRFERRLELSMEGHRLFDLWRYQKVGSDGTGYFVNTMTDFFDNEVRTLTSLDANDPTSVNLLFPVPQSALDQSAGILTQNPDY